MNDHFYRLLEILILALPAIIAAVSSLRNGRVINNEIEHASQEGLIKARRVASMDRKLDVIMKNGGPLK